MKTYISVPVSEYAVYEVEANSKEEAISEFCQNQAALNRVAKVTPEMVKTAVKPVTTSPRKAWEVKHFAAKKK